MYTWGYIKEAALAKLDMNEKEAEANSLLRKFIYYANEAITQICSAVKPKYTFFDVDIYKDFAEAKKYINKKYNVDIDLIPVNSTDKSKNEQAAVDEYSKVLSRQAIVNNRLIMPEDFISFGDDVNTMDYTNVYGVDIIGEEANDNDFTYNGYNGIIFKHSGTFHISYNARWFMFGHTTTDNTVPDVPADILDCIPSYIASQCYKIDDEVKAQIYRNEFEIAVARIDPANGRNTKTIKIDGGW